MTGDLVYLDNAATTFPKPRRVVKEMVESYARLGVSPGRGGYDLAAEAEDLVRQTRRKLARFFGAPDPERIIFAANATDALNLAIQGLVKEGGHVVSTRLEHNSVLRPLHHLRRAGLIDFDLAPFDAQGFVDPDDIARAIRTNTCLVVLSHASNVLGAIQAVDEVGRICAERGMPLVIDAAQSAGVVPVDLTAWRAGAVAFTGHKSLMGPTGIGGLAVSPELEVNLTRYGGTGFESESLFHTSTYPHRLEAGTLNLLGIIGLSAGLDFVLSQGLTKIHEHEMELWARLRDGLAELPEVRFYGRESGRDRVAVLTINLEGFEPSDFGAILDADYNIAVRAGLHCAPLVHQALGTAPRGGVRFSLGPFNTAADVARTIEAVWAIAGR